MLLQKTMLLDNNTQDPNKKSTTWCDSFFCNPRNQLQNNILAKGVGDNGIHSDYNPVVSGLQRNLDTSTYYNRNQVFGFISTSP